MPEPSLSIAIPPPIQPLIDDYIRLVTTRLPNFLTGFYLLYLRRTRHHLENRWWNLCLPPYAPTVASAHSRSAEHSCGNLRSSYRFRIVRAIAARAFLLYIIDVCNADMT